VEYSTFTFIVSFIVITKKTAIFALNPPECLMRENQIEESAELTAVNIIIIYYFIILQLGLYLNVFGLRAKQL